MRIFLQVTMAISLFSVASCHENNPEKKTTNIDLSNQVWLVEKAPEKKEKSSENRKQATIPILPNELFSPGKPGLLDHVILTTRLKLSRRDILSLKNPGFVFTGIGDNWAVYLNGNLLRNEVFVKDNKIIHSRYKQRVVIPFPKVLLKEENDLVIHLYGYAKPRFAFMQNFYGLRFASGHMMSEADVLQAQQFQFSKMIIYSVFFFFGLYHGLLYFFRRQDNYNLYFSLFLISMAFYFLARSYYAASLLLDQRWLLGTIFMTQVAALSFFLAFLQEFIRLKKKRSQLILISHCVNGSIILGMLGLGYQYYLSLLVIWYPLAVIQIIYLLYYIISAARKKIADARSMLVSIVVSSVIVAWDMLDTYYFRTNVRLLEFAILSLVLSIVGILAGHFVSLHNKTENLNRSIIKQKNSFYRFVPEQFLQFLNRDSLEDVQIGDAIRQNMTVLFSDIRDFSTMSEKMSTLENFSFLNAYLERTGPEIYENNGFIDKFIGDAILALFPRSADDALQAAVGMRRVLDKYNQHRLDSGYSPIRVGFGLNYGPLMLGTIGSDSRMDTTVVGDTVNTAARIESLTKVYRSNILISESLLKNLQNPEKYKIREIDSVRVKGKEKPAVIHEVYDFDDEEIIVKKNKIEKNLQLGIAFYKAAQFKEAYREFKECYEVFPEDRIVRMYIKRTQLLLKSPPDESKWDGVFRMRVK